MNKHRQQYFAYVLEWHDGVERQVSELATQLWFRLAGSLFRLHAARAGFRGLAVGAVAAASPEEALAVVARGEWQTDALSYYGHYRTTIEATPPGPPASRIDPGALDERRRAQAEEAFALHDFGPECVKDFGGWSVRGNEWSMPVFLEGPGASSPVQHSFVVRFAPGGVDVLEEYLAK